MYNGKINIDLDKNITNFCKENIYEKVDIDNYIQEIVKNITNN